MDRSLFKWKLARATYDDDKRRPIEYWMCKDGFIDNSKDKFRTKEMYERRKRMMIQLHNTIYIIRIINFEYEHLSNYKKIDYYFLKKNQAEKFLNHIKEKVKTLKKLKRQAREIRKINR